MLVKLPLCLRNICLQTLGNEIFVDLFGVESDFILYIASDVFQILLC